MFRALVLKLNGKASCFSNILNIKSLSSLQTFTTCVAKPNNKRQPSIKMAEIA